MLRGVSQDSRWTSKIQETLAELDRLEERLTRLRGGFEEGSRAAVDARARNGNLAWSFAAAAVQVAFDHLRGWRHLHGSGMQPPFAHWTLLRAAVEGAVVARWLCSPETSAQRRARGLGAQLADFDQRQGFESRVATAMPRVRGPRVAASQRIDQLRTQAAADGISGQRLPGPTSLVALHAPPAELSGESVDAEVLYRLLSAFAHGKMWAMPVLNDVVRGEKVALAPELAVTTVTAPADIVWLLTDWAVTCVRLAIADFERYSKRSG